MPVIIQPHTTIRLERKEGSQKSTDERHQATKHWNSACDDVGDENGAGGAAEPCQVVYERVL